MIIFYFGDPGSGKTLSMIKDAADIYKERHCDIYSNTHLFNLPYTLITQEDLLNWANESTSFENAIILITEAHVFGLDSRTSMKKSNRVLSYLLTQMRKKKCSVLADSQYPRQIDVRLRDLSDITVECHHNMGSDMFFNKIRIKKMNGIVMKTRIFNGTPYYKYYDTEEVITIPKLNKKTRDKMLEY